MILKKGSFDRNSKLSFPLRAKFIALLFVGICQHAFAETPAQEKEAYSAGEKKSQMCIGCHGVKGISANEMWPNLAGQKKTYLSQQLSAFKSGERKNPVMSAMAAQLSDTDIQNIATYFSKLPGSP